MKGSVKFIATAIAFCLTIGVLMVGIFAATGGSMVVESLIGWQSIGVEMDINGKVTGNKSSDNIASSYSDSLTIQHDNKVSAWQIGSINFDIKDDLAQNKRYSEPVVIRFGVTNTSINNVNIYYYFSSAPTTIPNVQYEYQLAYGVLGAGETWQTDFFSDSYSGELNVSGVSDKYYSLHKDTEYNFLAPGETVVFEMRFTVINYTQNVSTSSNPLEANLVFQNSPREGGTMYNPYIISSAEDFNMYASNGGFANSNNYFLQTSNIAFNSTQTAQAVSAPRSSAISEDSALVVTDFLAHYDGGNNQIDLSGTNSPLFNAVGSEYQTTASLENLTVYNGNYQIQLGDSSMVYTCGVAMNLYGRLVNVNFSGEVTVSTSVNALSFGGLVNTMHSGGIISGCSNRANITAKLPADTLIGGLVSGCSSSGSFTIINSYNSGDIAISAGTNRYVGGLCATGSNITLTNCYNSGNLKFDDGSYVYGNLGALLGNFSNGINVKNCYNTGSGFDSGVIGRCGFDLTLTNCINYGKTKGANFAVSCDTSSLYATNCYVVGVENGFDIGKWDDTASIYVDSGTSCSKYLNVSQAQKIESYSGFTFDASNWVWANAIIKINGKEKAMQLPRLAFEKLEYALDRSSLYVLNGTTSGEYTYYGAYPQNYVGNTLNTTLKSALSAGTLKPTGWSYTTHINGTMTTLPEYLYDGNYYAYLESAFDNPSSSGGFITGDAFFFKVEPLKWKKYGDVYFNNLSLANMRFDDSSNVWANSDVRAWLNEEFYISSGLNMVISGKSTVANNSSSSFIDGSGTSTKDYIWIPSYEEIGNWFPSGFSGAVLSDISAATGGYYDCGNQDPTWLRTSYPSTTDKVYRICYDGSVREYSIAGYSGGGVVPCFIPDPAGGAKVDRSSVYALNGTTSGEYTYYGAYPQNYVYDDLNATLKSALAAGTLQETGWRYTTDINGTTTILPEYLYEGNYYAYLESANKIMAGAMWGFETGQAYFFKVEPLKWKNYGGIFVCDQSIASMRFDDSSNIWANSEVRSWLNEVFYIESGMNQVKTTKSTIKNNSTSSTSDGSGTSTEDYLFLPSYAEIIQFYPSGLSWGLGCSYLYDATYGYVDSGSADPTFLRTAYSGTSSSVYAVRYEGSVNYSDITNTFGGILPCFIPDVGAGSDNFTGVGSESDPFIIASAEDYNTFATTAYFGNKDYYFKQVADITLTSYNPVTLVADYDGGGKTITIAPASSGDCQEPLFISIGSSLNAIERTNFKNVRVNFSGNVIQGIQCRGIARSILNTNVENVQTSGGPITLPVSDSQILISGSGAAQFGAIAQSAQNSKFINCHNSASISTTYTTTIGGLVGYVINSEFNYCSNSGSISATKASSVGGRHIGGVLGYVHTSSTSFSMKNCFNTGSITISGDTSGNAGGLIGAVSGTQTSLIQDCYNTGTITSSFTNTGGLIAYISCSPVSGTGVSLNANVKNCYNTAASLPLIYGFSSFIPDYMTYPTLKNCYNIGDKGKLYEYCDSNTTVTVSNSFANAGTVGFKTLAQLQTQSTYTTATWAFGTYGVANSGWVWRNSSIIVNGTNVTYYSLPRLWYEGLTWETIDQLAFSIPVGTGTASDPYTIASDEDFIKYSTAAYFGNSNLYFKQVADISYDGSVQTNLIAGYDGNGKTIDITGTTRPLWNNIGVEFSNAFKDKIRLRNLKVVCNGTTATSAIANNFYTGRILNVSLSGSFTVSKWYGLIKYMGDYANISYCVNNANIVAEWKPTTTTSEYESNEVTLAGIVGSQANDGFTNISYCGNNGNLTGYNVAGVIGSYCIYNGASILGCFNTGNITSNGNWASGIAGTTFLGSNNGKIEECYNNGNISGTDAYSLVYKIGDIGDTTTNITIKNCYSTCTSGSYLVRIFAGTLIFESTYCVGGAVRGDSSSNVSIDAGGLKITSPYSHSQSDFTSFGFSFGTYGVANSGWVWRTADLKVNGVVNGTYSLPRLWYEDLTMETIMALLGANYSGSMVFNICACSGCEYYSSALNDWEWCSNCSKNNLCDFCGGCSGHGCSHLGSGTASAVPQIYIDGVEQSNVAIAGASTIGDYVQALDGSQYPGYFFDADLTQYVEEKDYATQITSETKLYTKRATLDYLTFTSNGDGTCSVAGSDNVANICIPRLSSSGDTVTAIADNAFANYQNLESIIIPNTVLVIGSDGFGHTGLINVEIPNSVTIINYLAFAFCLNLSNITIGDGVTTIGQSAFVECSSLEKIYIPISVTTINIGTAGIFAYGNENLKIYCGASSKPENWANGWAVYEEMGWSKITDITWGVTREQYNSLYA